MANLEKELLEELKRFNQIGYNSKNLNEQNMGGGFGNLGMGSHVDRILGKSELGEQEESEMDVDTEEGSPPPLGQIPPGFDEVEIGDVEGVEGGSLTPPPAPPAVGADPTQTAAPSGDDLVPADGEGEGDTTEVDVTDIVTKQEGLEKTSGETNQKLDTLMNMLTGMEEKLSGMDDLMTQIEDIENKIEKFRPKTQEEKVELRKLDSGPYNQSLVDFWDDSQDKFEAQGKQEYILTPEDVDNFSDTEIKKSFDSSDY
jgi:hypothetical protein